MPLHGAERPVRLYNLPILWAKSHCSEGGREAFCELAWLLPRRESMLLRLLFAALALSRGVLDGRLSASS